MRWEGGRWKARITVEGRERLVPIEPPLRRRADKAKAIVEARALSDLTPGKAAPPSSSSPSGVELVDDWYERWLATKEDKGQTSVAASRSHLRTHLLPILRGKRMTDVDERDLEKIVAKLDGLIDTGELRWKSARNVWGTVTKGFDDAHRGKVVELRVLTRNPVKNVRGPDRGVETEKVHLYPSEFSKLLACAAVPIFRRRYYAIAVYNYLRPAELEALRWEDVDLARRIVHVRRGIDRTKDTDKAPKAGRARSPFDLETTIVALLKVMHAEARGQGYVVGRLGDERALAETLRADLLVAGVHRFELHNGSDDPPREWMTMHDLRTTGITWMAVRGDEPLIVMARAGHSDFKTTLGYVNRAALIRRSYGAPFPRLPAKMLERAPIKEGFPETFPERNRHLRGKAELSGGNAWESNAHAARSDT